MTTPKTPLQMTPELVKKGFLASLAKKLTTGQKVSPADTRLLLELSAEQTGSAWPTRQAMCADLSEALGETIHVRKTYEYQRHGAPIPRSGPIDKAAFWRWMAIEKREKGRPGDSSKADLERQKLQHEVELLRGKVATLHRETIPAAEVRATIATAVEDLRTALRVDLPAKAVELATAHEREEAVEMIRDEIDTRLQALAAAAPAAADRAALAVATEPA